LAQVLTSFRKLLEKQLTRQTVNILALLLVFAITMLASQLFIALMLLKALGR
jgi:hypothetical protein